MFFCFPVVALIFVISNPCSFYFQIISHLLNIHLEISISHLLNIHLEISLSHLLNIYLEISLSHLVNIHLEISISHLVNIYFEICISHLVNTWKFSLVIWKIIGNHAFILGKLSF